MIRNGIYVKKPITCIIPRYDNIVSTYDFLNNNNYSNDINACGIKTIYGKQYYNCRRYNYYYII